MKALIPETSYAQTDVAYKLIRQHEVKIVDVVIVTETPTGRRVTVDHHCHIEWAPEEADDPDMVEVVIEGEEFMNAIKYHNTKAAEDAETARQKSELEKETTEAYRKLKDKQLLEDVTDYLSLYRRNMLKTLVLAVVLNAVITLLIVSL